MNIKKPDLKKLNLKKPEVHLSKLHLPGKESGEQKKEEGKKTGNPKASDKITVTAKKTRKRVVLETDSAESSRVGKNTESAKTGKPAETARSERRQRYNVGYIKKADLEKQEQAEKDYGVKSHSAQRKDREKQKIRKARQEARKKEAMRMRLILGGAAAAVLLVLVLVLALGHGSKNKTESVADTAESAEESPSSRVWQAGEIPHLSFRVLLSDYMAGDDSVLTVNQFRQVLQQLYDENYILVDFYRIANIETQEDGTHAFKAAELELPAGKKPFILSQRDVSYSLDRVGKGYASRLVLDENGTLVNEYQNLDGSVMVGAYDVVPVLEEFIAEHPDFAYEGARGVLGLTGYNGILGYRTSEMLAKNTEEGNPYAVYGTFDVNAEIEAAKPVVDALKNSGWHLASYGYNYCSYGAEQSMVTADVDAWMANVSSIIGGTDLLIFPCETDIGNWSEYTAENQKYQYLKGKGFSYYCIEDDHNPSWLQVRDDYVRQGIKEIDCWNDFVQIMEQQPTE